MHELHTAVSQQRGQRAAVRGNIGHFAGTRQRHPVFAAKPGSECESAGHLLRFAGVGFERKRQRVELEFAGLHEIVESLTAGGCLATPILKDLRHDPAGSGPGELLFRRKVLRLVHDVHRLVNHAGLVMVDNLLDAVGIPDVAVGLDDDDDFLEIRADFRRLDGAGRR